MTFIPVFLDWPETTEALTSEEKGRLLDALCLYARGDEYAHLLQGNERYIFPVMREQINRANAEREAKAEAARENGKRGGRPKKTEPFFEEPKKPNPFFENPENPNNNNNNNEYENNNENNNTSTPLYPPVEEELPAADSAEAYVTNNLQHMSATAMEECVDYIEDLGADIVKHAVDQACDAGKRTWGYCKAILNRYAESGIKTLGDAKASDERFRASRPRGDPKQNPALNYTQRDHGTAQTKTIYYDPETWEAIPS